MLNKLIIPIVTVLMLGACSSTPTVLDQSETLVVTPPKNLFNCPQVNRSNLPNAETLTNQQVAGTIVTLWEYNRICGINMKKIEENIEENKKALQ